jgi:hypothetical protein
MGETKAARNEWKKNDVRLARTATAAQREAQRAILDVPRAKAVGGHAG